MLSHFCTSPTSLGSMMTDDSEILVLNGYLCVLGRVVCPVVFSFILFACDGFVRRFEAEFQKCSCQTKVVKILFCYRSHPLIFTKTRGRRCKTKTKGKWQTTLTFSESTNSSYSAIVSVLAETGQSYKMFKVFSYSALVHYIFHDTCTYIWLIFSFCS